MSDAKITGRGLAAGAILNSLLDTLLREKTLTLGQVRETLTNSLNGLIPYNQTPEGFEASQIITNLLGNRFTERR